MDGLSRLLPADPAADLAPSGLLPQPYGETPYLELIEHYAETARTKRARGADKLIAHGMPGLAEARAAVLGARAVQLPLYLTISAAQDGRQAEPERLLAALICLQELGVMGFGLETYRVTGDFVEEFTLLAPYARVPLIARVYGEADEESYRSLLLAGVDILCCEPDQAETARRSAGDLKPRRRPQRPEGAPLLLCGESEVYYLEEDFTLSDEIECSLDMAEDILKMENQACDALCFHIQTADDAYFFGLNAHMARKAVCLLAEDAGFLEMALAMYCGRALVDARSDVDEQALLELANSYGAIVR